MRHYLLAVLAMSLGSAASYAQEATQKPKEDAKPVISGRVFGSNNLPLAGVKVTLLVATLAPPTAVGEKAEQGSKPKGSAVGAVNPPSSHVEDANPSFVRAVDTDAAGCYAFNLPPVGTYLISASLDGYHGATHVLEVDAPPVSAAKPETEKQNPTTLPNPAEPPQSPTDPCREKTILSTDFRLKEHEFFIPWGDRRGLDITLVQPGTFVFYDVGTDDNDVVDFFDGGKVSLALQLVGADFVLHSDRSRRIRLGINTGFAIGAAQVAAPTIADPKAKKEAATFVYSGSLFIDVARIVRIEAGYMTGRAAADITEGKSRDDSAVFVGISLRTALNKELLKVFR